jgi:hypothetical protein
VKELIMTRRTYLIVTATIAIAIVVLNLAAAGRPPAKDFGPGPRTSERGLYVAALQDAQELKPRKMYTLRATVIDGSTGRAVSDATVAVDGGMPQHGHGLPTRPRVTKNFGNGTYEIQGVRFNMGGWWELKLVITTPAGTDTVTFNLSV